MTPFLELDRLAVALGGRPILKGISGALTGRAVGLLGPNGAGKTTLIHTLLGFHRPRGGAARLLGHDVASRGRALRRLVGYMPENDAFIPGLTAVRYVRMMAEISGLPRDAALERAHEALFYVGLGEARYRKLETFSLGMKQQAKLAQAIVHGPKVLFLDEPTNGLDPPHRRRMLDLVREIKDAGEMHIVLSSHLLRDVEEACDEVLVLNQGEIAAQCDLEAERRAATRLFEIETVGDRDGFVAAAAKIGCEFAASGKRRLKLVLPDGVTVTDLYRIAAERDVQLRRLDQKRSSLEEIFLEAVGGGEINGSL